MATIHGLIPFPPDINPGQHASDLIKRGIISDEGDGSLHIVSVPPTKNERVILDLMETTKIQQDHILSICGIMGKNPNGIASFHFLFGHLEKGKTNPDDPKDLTGLKVAVAGPRTADAIALIEHCRNRGMRIIETNPIEHDSMMAITQ
jgi:prephenate dehydrogenase